MTERSESLDRGRHTGTDRESAGYASAAYVKSLSEFGRPLALPESGGWLLQRPIDGTNDTDAMGPYPLFDCRDWSSLPADLARLDEGLVSVVSVPTPFGQYDLSLLRRSFPDLCRPFKTHHVIDLTQDPSTFVSPHHLRNARKARRQLAFDFANDPLSTLTVWTELYDTLKSRHGIAGIAGFSKKAFRMQFCAPGLVVQRATWQGRTVGMLLWYVKGEVAYYHLGAYDERGYRLRASFGLFWNALEYFSGIGLKMANLGGGAGFDKDADSGLERFKSGWATETRTAYICGRILDARRYAELSDLVTGRAEGTDYFPAYRRTAR